MIVTISNPENGLEELSILEFQGEIAGSLPGQTLGVINIKDKSSAELTIGIHVLEGEIVRLKSPLLLAYGTEGSSPGLNMRGIIKSKIIFKKRPTPRTLPR